MRAAPAELTAMIRPTIESLGYELVGVELQRRGQGGTLLRIYIDRPDGITVDDCGAVSHQVSGILDVEDPIPGHYDLEVSSPGLDRPLFALEHFARFRGRRARLRLSTKIGGRRRLEGVLRGIEGDAVVIECDGETFRLTLGQVDVARLIPEF